MIGFSMSLLSIYIFGIVVAFIIGIFGLSTSIDKECNIDHLGCVIAALMLALFSWAAVIYYIASEIRNRYIK